MAVAVTDPIPNLVERLRNVHVDVREDLEISRHLFRGDPSYVIRDPVTFQSHCFSLPDYRILASLSSRQPLGDIFRSLVQSGQIREDQETSFYEFVVFLHRAGFLNLPIADGRMLYNRFKARQSAMRRAKLFGFMYLEVPLWNPDNFLNSTLRYVQPLFSRTFCYAWVVMILCAALIALTRWRDLAEPLGGLLAIDNLLIMWCTLIGLKFCHELGHAYACKQYGLHVPMMGVYIVAGIPCAYVDASASWGLTNRRERIVISMGGMYFESIISVIAVWVWSLTTPGLINSIAYNTVFLASVATILFNINPLMRYDGYFVLSDLVEVPNLGQRSAEYVSSLLKHYLLGLPMKMSVEGVRLKSILLSYGMAAPAYRTIVMVAIVAVLASRLYMVGLLLGSLFVAYLLTRTLVRLIRYLGQSEETAPVRARAVSLGMAAIILLPSAAAFIPVRIAIQARGVAYTGTETVVRADTAGFLSDVARSRGQSVRTGDSLVTLNNDTMADVLREAEARLQATRVRRNAYRFTQPARAIEEERRLTSIEREVAERQKQLNALNVHAPVSGQIVACLESSNTGQYVSAGTEIATIVSGTGEIRALLSEQDVAIAKLALGHPVQCRSTLAPRTVLHGVIERISPAGNRRIHLPALTHIGGGDIAVSTETGEAMQPYFQVIVRLADTAGHAIPHGATVWVRLPAQHEPIAMHLYRRITRFVDSLRKA